MFSLSDEWCLVEEISGTERISLCPTKVWREPGLPLAVFSELLVVEEGAPERG